MKASKSVPIAVATAALLLGGCARHHGDIDETGGITAVRSACPIVGLPANTGDVTLFDPATSRDSTAIDLVATMTNLRSTCDDTTDQIGTTVTFDVDARRTHAEGARDVTLPYFITVVRGGNVVVAKRVGAVALHFDAGRPRAHTTGTASSAVSRAAATLPEAVREKLTRKRKAGDADAAIDPLTQPDIRKAVASATFEALVGFQLTDDQLKYNATR
ncbi:hypothetical protein [Sphingomonas sp. CROZ-RG-20F-R02-07]|uniref:hypothetical protein n=1 Tax=Sphingomonas sp. CROZ-RG-20F-R02-07 TaxID=2914832 RepID=UPI001F58839C